MTKKGNTNKSRGQLSHVGMPMDIHIIAHTYRLGVTDGKNKHSFLLYFNKDIQCGFYTIEYLF